mmetsp:Transcript_131625/g.281449  ORF Transcript_131625/g.281449 Transcript_131625/m.281449 type:complete len:199 (-) Transcript_131625:97-693(-)
MMLLSRLIGPMAALSPLVSGQSLTPKQHVCCLPGDSVTGVHATLPEAWNHSALQHVECASVEKGLYVKRRGTACAYCTCLHQDGADFSPPDCCSLLNFGSPGTDPETGHPICQKYRTTYDLKDGSLRSCELRYDLYPFASSSAGPGRRRELRLAAAATVLSTAIAVVLAAASVIAGDTHGTGGQGLRSSSASKRIPCR